MRTQSRCMMRVKNLQPASSVAIRRMSSRNGNFWHARLGCAYRVGPCFRSRNIAASGSPHHPPKSKPQTPSAALISAVQWTCVFSVLGIQTGLVVERLQGQTVESRQLSSHTVHSPTPTSFIADFSQYQPLFLAIGVMCAMLTKLSPDREPAVASAPTAVSAALQQRAVLERLDGSIRQMDRKLSKMQSRVVLCVEQYRGVRTSSEEARATMNTILSTHGTALAELQEQTNSLQKVVSSMQDVVVKQIQVMTPPLKSLSTRVKSLEQEMQALREQVQSQQATPQSVASGPEIGTTGPGGTQQSLPSPPKDQPIRNDASAGASFSVAQIGSGQHAHSRIPASQQQQEEAGVVLSGCPGSSDTNLSRKGSGRMHLATWKVPNVSHSHLQFIQADSVEASIFDGADDMNECSDGSSNVAVLSDSSLHYNAARLQLGKHRRSAQLVFAPFNPLHVPYTAHGSAVAAQPDTSMSAAVTASRKAALHSLMLTAPSPVMSTASTLALSTATGLQTDANLFAPSSTQAVSQFPAALPADTSASMAGIRGMLVAASLLVNLLVAQACV